MRTLAADEVGAIDASDFESFFEAEYPRLFGTMCMATGNRADAEDVTQEAFLKLWARREELARLKSPVAYLYRTAFNLAHNRRRAARRAARRVLLHRPDPDPLQAADDRATLLPSLRSLPPRARSALILIDLVRMTSEEAGQILGVKPSTVRALATQARAELRRTLGGAYD